MDSFENQRTNKIVSNNNNGFINQHIKIFIGS